MAICTSLNDFPEIGDVVKLVKVWDTHNMDHVAEIVFESGKTVAFHYWYRDNEYNKAYLEPGEYSGETKLN